MIITPRTLATFLNKITIKWCIWDGNKYGFWKVFIFLFPLFLGFSLLESHFNLFVTVTHIPPQNHRWLLTGARKIYPISSFDYIPRLNLVLDTPVVVLGVLWSAWSRGQVSRRGWGGVQDGAAGGCIAIRVSGAQHLRFSTCNKTTYVTQYLWMFPVISVCESSPGNMCWVHVLIYRWEAAVHRNAFVSYLIESLY